MKTIGILLPLAKMGGVFQYALSIVESLIHYSDKFEYSILHYDVENPREVIDVKDKGVEFVSIPQKSPSLTKKIVHFLGLISGINFFLIKNLYLTLKKHKIDLLIVPTPFNFELPLEVPYIVSIPDLMHKYYPYFPEYGIKQRLMRDVVYGYFATHSILNIVDSQQGAQDLHKFFDISEKKIKIIPYVPPGYIYRYNDMSFKTADRLLKKYNLPEKFLFYPAQLWYHKNHVRLIKALNSIKEKHGIKIPLVLTGSLSGRSQKNYQKIKKLARNLKVENQIIHLGYISEKEIVALYKACIALVFPTLIEPTSIPPLEAMVLGKPVLCSGFPENKKQIGKAGIFFNPFSEKDMAEKIYKLWLDKKLRKELTRQAREKAKEITIESFAKKWEKVIEEALKIYEQKRS